MIESSERAYCKNCKRRKKVFRDNDKVLKCRDCMKVV